ncbi:hypothetical protein M758_UG061100 [Ceratodon purpureus]|nr:hypothetical protein M758_UG061100 [Ceratodon purpureus]
MDKRNNCTARCLEFRRATADARTTPRSSRHDDIRGNGSARPPQIALDNSTKPFLAPSEVAFYPVAAQLSSLLLPRRLDLGTIGRLLIRGHPTLPTLHYSHPCKC